MKQQTQAATFEKTLKNPQPLLREKWLRVARVCWILLAVVALVIFVTSLPGYAQRIISGTPAHGSVDEATSGHVFLQAINSIMSLASGALSFYLSVLLFRRKFENPAAAVVSFYLVLYGIVLAGPLEAWGMYWLGNTDFAINMQALLMATPTVALLVLFPNGNFVPAWTRWVLIASIPWNFIAVLSPLFPFRDGDIAGLLILGSLWFSLLGLGIYAQIFRYRRFSTPDERQQTKWVLFGFVLWIGYILISTYPYFYITSLPDGAPQPWWTPLSELGWWLSLNIIPVSLAVAINRSRLWNIDIVINRALVYGALTFITMALYIIVVGTLGTLLKVGDSTFIAFLTTGLVAVLFQPLRARVQQWVNRLMYGERDDPVAVLTKLGEELEHTGSPEAALSSIAESVAITLKLPYVAIELGENNEIAASYGMPRDEVLRVAMLYQTETSGTLVVAPRSPGEPFSSTDRQLLENIAHQAGAAAHAVKLTADLRISRQRLVTAREEERRRLRRDLHDGLGPTLASLTLKLDATRNLMRADPDKAENLLDELKTQTQETIQDIRNLVYDLRPPALDELGLIRAIQSFIEGKSSHHPHITLEIPAELPPLPAAFEVAIYRITLEGITNMIRHANASTVTIRIRLKDRDLFVDIVDDGNGLLEGHPAGVGLASMRERAEELGGTFELIPEDQGMHIRA